MQIGNTYVVKLKIGIFGVNYKEMGRCIAVILGIFMVVGHVYAASLSYYNPLNDLALNNDFLSQTKSGSGTFESQNSRLEFSTSTYCTAVKELLTPLSISEGFSVSVQAHLNTLAGLNWGDQLKIGFGLSNQSLSSVSDYQNKVTVYLKRDYYNDYAGGSLDNHVTNYLYTNLVPDNVGVHTGARGSWTDVILKAEYDASSKMIVSSYKIVGQDTFNTIATKDLGTSWGLKEGDILYLYLYGSSSLYNSSKLGAQVVSGDMYMTDLNIVPEPSSLSLLLIGVAGLASRRLLGRKGRFRVIVDQGVSGAKGGI